MNEEEYEEEYLEDESYYTDDKRDEMRLIEKETEILNYNYKIIKKENNKIIFQTLENSNAYLEIEIKYISFYTKIEKSNNDLTLNLMFDNPLKQVDELVKQAKEIQEKYDGNRD